MTPTDGIALQPIRIGGRPWFLYLVDGTQTRKIWEGERAATLADLCAVLAALPEAERRELVAPYAPAYSEKARAAIDAVLIKAESECARLESELREERERHAKTGSALLSAIDMAREQQSRLEEKLAASEAANAERIEGLWALIPKDLPWCSACNGSGGVAKPCEACRGVGRLPPPPEACSTCPSCNRSIFARPSAFCDSNGSHRDGSGHATPAASGPATGREVMARELARRDDDGHCTRCGLSWDYDTEAGDEHVCPPGFWTEEEARRIMRKFEKKRKESDRAAGEKR